MQAGRGKSRTCPFGFEILHLIDAMHLKVSILHLSIGGQWANWSLINFNRFFLID